MCDLRGRLRVDAGNFEGGKQLGKAEVEDLDVPVLRDEDVLGLQVPMDDAFLVRRGKALRDLEGVVDGLASAAAARSSFSRSVSPSRSSMTAYGLPSCVAEVVDREDVRDGQSARPPGLPLEARQALGIRGKTAGRTLIATSRSSCVSRARYTSPIPPAPSGDRIS